MTLVLFSGACGKMIHEKIGRKKSRDTVPLRLCSCWKTPCKGFLKGLRNGFAELVSNFIEAKENISSELVNKKAINFKVVFH
jgi:hypothetical protein